MTSAQRRLVEEEDKFRRLFAEDASSRELQDPHVLLEDVFSLGPHQWTFQDEDAEEKKVPKLLEQNRQPVAHGRAIVDSKDQFLTNWEAFTKGMFKGLDWTNIFIAGGAVLACLQPDGMTKYPTSDIDIFVHGIDDDEQANNLLKHIHSTIKANTQGEGIVIRTRRTVTIINSYPYRHTQVILRLYKSPAQVLLGFDVDCCTFGYDGNTVWAMERGRRALTKRYNLVNPSRRSLTYESRLFKYSKRGFAVAVPDLDKSRVNQRLLGPTATPSQFQGLAKLLVYDHRLSNPVPFYGRGRKAREQADEAKSDYDGDLIIPWGPGLTASAILHQLNATDKSQFFANKMKDMRSGNTGAATHKHLFVPGLDDLITGQFWCSTCAQKVELPEEEPLGIFVQRKVEWDRNALSYQDFDNGFKRALFTGSFQVKLNDDWALGAYQDGASGQQTPTRPATASFSSQTSVTPSSYSAGQLSSPSRATPVLSAAVSRGKLASPKKSPAKAASPSGALPSFASSYNQAAPSPAKKEPEDGQFVCEYCKMSFLSQNQLYRHVRMTGHILQEPGSLSIAPSSSVSPYASASSASSLYTPPSSSYLVPASSYSQPVSYATAPSSPPRSPAPVTIPISPSQIYSAPTPLEFRSSSAADDLSQFGPQPGGSLYFTMPSPSPASDASSAYGYYGGASPSQPASVVEAPQASQPYGGASSYGTGSSSSGLPWEGKQVRDEMTKALLLLGTLKRQHKINDEERAVLKRLAIEGSDVLLACVQVYEIENDDEDLVHTLQRLALHHRL